MDQHVRQDMSLTIWIVICMTFACSTVWVKLFSLLSIGMQTKGSFYRLTLNLKPPVQP